LVYPFAAITIGFAGIVKVLVADEITDQASLGLLVFLIEPSIKMVPGTGQKPLPPVPVTQHVFVVVQSLCFPVFVTTSLIMRVSCGYLFQGRAPTIGESVLRRPSGATRLLAAFDEVNAGAVDCIEDGSPLPFAFAINHSLPESLGRVLEPML
jgi:hypothetical protein